MYGRMRVENGFDVRPAQITTKEHRNIDQHSEILLVKI
jgi:hypothetical protein